MDIFRSLKKRFSKNDEKLLDHQPAKNKDKKRRSRKKKVEVVEYKSKWDQFCDFTSLVGFRLLSSKFPIWLRIPTALIMLACTALLCYSLKGAVSKYISSKGVQKQTVVHQSNDNMLPAPKLYVCHQSQFSRSGVDSKVSRIYNEDMRRLVFMHLMNDPVLIDSDVYLMPNHEYFDGFGGDEEVNGPEFFLLTSMSVLRSKVTLSF